MNTEAPTATEAAMQEVLGERARQNAKWGEQNHDPGTWALILLEEIGEWAKAELETRFGGPEAGNQHKEAVHMTAVALQIVEAMNRAEARRKAPPAPKAGKTMVKCTPRPGEVCDPLCSHKRPHEQHLACLDDCMGSGKPCRSVSAKSYPRKHPPEGTPELMICTTKDAPDCRSNCYHSTPHRHNLSCEKKWTCGGRPCTPFSPPETTPKTTPKTEAF
jgi:hypothetical protein